MIPSLSKFDLKYPGVIAQTKGPSPSEKKNTKMHENNAGWKFVARTPKQSVVVMWLIK